jgi:type I restriction enzyme S subunit
MSKRKETEFGTIPIHWDFIKASEYCSKVTDGTHDSPKQQTTGRYLITSKHIKGREIDFESAYLISQEDFEKINKRSYVERWDVIISMIGEYCGFTYIERNEKIDYAVKNVGLFKTGSELNALWLHYFLNSTIGKYILDINKSGSSQPYIALGSLRELPILIPPLNEKTAIVSILSSLDDKIDLLHRQNATLEKMAETLFRQWFVEEAKEEWEEIKLGSIVEIINGVSYKSDDLNPSTTAMVTLKSFERNGGFRMDGFKEYTGKYKEQHILKEGDLVVAHTDITQEADVIGNPVMVIGNPKYDTLVFSMDLVKVVSKSDNYSNEFLYLLMKSREFKEHCLGYSNGSTVLHLSKKAVPEYEMKLPPDNLINEFSKKVKPLVQKQFRNQTQIRTLTVLRDNLLPKLMNGEVKVI